MLTPVSSGRFKKDVKLAAKRGKDMSRLKTVLLLLIEGRLPPPEYRDHPLKGDWKGFRDSTLSRTGSCSIALKAMNCSLPAQDRMRISSTSRTNHLAA